MGPTLKNIFRLIIGHGRTITIDDSEPIQQVTCKLLEGETTIPRLQEYGLATHPPNDSHVMGVCSGQRKDLTAICVQANKRPCGLKQGEVVLYNEDIELRLTGNTAKFNTRKVEFDGLDLIKTLSELVEYLIQQAPIQPPDRFKNIQPLTQIALKLREKI